MVDFFKTWWKHVAAAVTGVMCIIGIITTIIVFDARYAKTTEQEKIETKVIETADKVKAIDVKQNVMRVNYPLP